MFSINALSRRILSEIDNIYFQTKLLWWFNRGTEIIYIHILNKIYETIRPKPLYYGRVVNAPD
jgi:hypothetical protein